MLPEVASSRPAINRNAVVFPQPDGPTRTVNCWSGISSEILLTAVTVPNFLDTPSRNTRAITAASGGSCLCGKVSPCSLGLLRSPFDRGDDVDRRRINPRQTGQIHTGEVAEHDEGEHARQVPVAFRPHLIDALGPAEGQRPRRFDLTGRAVAVVPVAQDHDGGASPAFGDPGPA